MYDIRFVGFHIAADVEAVVRRREIYFDLFVREVVLYKVDGRNQIGIGADKDYDVRSVVEAVSHHPDGKIHIRFLFFRTIYGIVAFGADDGLVDVFAPYYFEFVGMQNQVGIQECALSTAFGRIERGRCEIDDFREFLTGTEKLFEECYDINPVESFPAAVHFLLPLQSVVEVEAVHIECNSPFIHKSFKSKKPLLERL